MKLISIEITDDGEHWRKTIKILGLTVYHRHDFTKDNKPRPIGFVQFPDSIVEVEDEDWCDNEFKQ